MSLGGVLVGGEGPKPCAAMIVGEAPGRQECEKCLPFVGPSGQLLNEALTQFGILRREVYVTNAVPYMPLDADGRIRPPTYQEVAKYGWRLVIEIKMVMPEAILCLGRVAQYALLGSNTVRFGGHHESVYVAWHPSYVLRQGRANYDQWLDQLKPWVDAVYDWL